MVGLCNNEYSLVPTLLTRCTATFTPPVNEMPRVEYKSVWLSRLIKNDHILDIEEFRCLTIQYAMNLAYNSDPIKNCDEEIERVLERFEDVICVIGRLDLSTLNPWEQDLFLDGIDILLRQMGIVAKNNPESPVLEVG